MPRVRREPFRQTYAYEDAHVRERRLPSRRRLRIPSNVNNVKQPPVSGDSRPLGAVARTGKRGYRTLPGPESTGFDAFRGFRRIGGGQHELQ